MEKIELLSYQKALEKARLPINGKEPQLKLLLGNGFSRAYDEHIFSYDALLQKATFAKHGPLIKKVFARLKTSDFERVIRLFVEMKTVLQEFPKTWKRLISFASEVEGILKKALADTLAANHPDGPFSITEVEYTSVREFLRPYKDIYTLNYDLLLYWSLLHNEGGQVINVDDGFRNPDVTDCDYVTWEPENRYNQCVHYLHGALHLFDSGDEIRKFTWCRTGIRLKEQILAELNADRYPLIVTEGRSSSKKGKIFHNIYLASSYKSLLATGGVIFIYGASLQEHDEHILHALKENPKIGRVFCGLYGDVGNLSAVKTIERIRQLSVGLHKKEVYFFDAKSAKVWR